MLVIRRRVTQSQGYTVFMLDRGYYKEFPTTEREHAQILKIYKQDKHYKDIINDFSEFKL
jgi:hypothetical protein